MSESNYIETSEVPPCWINEDNFLFWVVTDNLSLGEMAGHVNQLLEDWDYDVRIHPLELLIKGEPLFVNPEKVTDEGWEREDVSRTPIPGYAMIMSVDLEAL